MQPFPKSTTNPIGKIGTVVFDPSKNKIDPNILKGLFPPTCNSTFSDHFATIKKQSVSATVTILPNNGDTLNYPAMNDTTLTFKPKDDALAKALTNWDSTLKVPSFTVAYVLFSNVTYLSGGKFDAILCISTAAEGKHHLFLQSVEVQGVWTSDLTITYCKKNNLYTLTSYGYTMLIDFGL